MVADPSCLESSARTHGALYMYLGIYKSDMVISEVSLEYLSFSRIPKYINKKKLGGVGGKKQKFKSQDRLPGPLRPHST